MSVRFKRLSALLIAILLVSALLPTTALAAGKIETDRPVELTIDYKDGEKAIPDAQFALYKVADVDEYARMSLTEEFAAFKSSVSGLADLENIDHDKWLELSSTLKGIVHLYSITPAYDDYTDLNGVLPLSIEPGLYLVIGYRTTTDDFYTYTATPYMIFLPGEDAQKNEWSYSVTTSPKYDKDYFPPDELDPVITRKVIKQWDDEGYETIRPEEVIVQLLKDGKVDAGRNDSTVSLNASNNWRYAWDLLEANHEWEVVEKVPEGYVVTTTQNGITFVITNKYLIPITDTDIPIQKRITGDKPKTNSTFTFVFSAINVSCPMPEGSNGTVKEISITGAGSKGIGEITFEKPGTYVYSISEKNGGVEGYTYDSTVYTVTYEVTEKDGELSITRTIKDNKGNITSAIEFTNPYKTPGNKLPQTGILWWPVPLLLCAGLAFVMIGVIRRRKCN